MTDPSENEVVRLWQSLLKGDGLQSEDGSPVKVIYPGRPGDGHGPDFRDALIMRNGDTAAGDIEIHVRSSHWTGHCHHTDPAYNGVVLHVVWRHDTEGATPRQDGWIAPVIALSRYAARAPPTGEDLPYPGPPLPCRLALQSFTPDSIGRILDEAGGERFLIKSARFQSALAQTEPDQVFYEGIMEALGYTRNVAPFRALARRLPLGVLQKTARGAGGEKGHAMVIEKMLLEASGLGPGVAPRHGWDTSCVRPQNSPVRRLMALGCLLVRYRKTGLLEGLLSAVRETPEKCGHKWLEEALTVTAPGKDGKQVTILGGQRAAIIVINVLLPFAHVWGACKGEPGIMERTVDLYRRYPVRESNTIERHMCRQLALERTLVNSAQRQQGLIHVYKTLCTQGECGRCSFVSRR